MGWGGEGREGEGRGGEEDCESVGGRLTIRDEARRWDVVNVPALVQKMGGEGWEGGGCDTRSSRGGEGGSEALKFQEWVSRRGRAQDVSLSCHLDAGVLVHLGWRDDSQRLAAVVAPCSLARAPLRACQPITPGLWR